MKVRLIIMVILSLTLILPTNYLCLAGRIQKQKREGKVQYFYSETSADPKLEKVILQTIPDYSKDASDNPDQFLRYYYNRIDLNGDGRPETVVYLSGRYVCGTGGCEVLIFEFTGQGYKLISDISLARNPVIVSDRKTRGWNDLIMYVAGGGIMRGYYTVLRFDGQKYPENPTVEPALNSISTVKGKALIADDIPSSPGIFLRPTKAQ